ncbi:glycosyltransferase family 2 protein [Tepidibacillus marianensis]|uniref:glycosyltransferase family 2 protein n=1 Tax=Tepidibacillus marianensis TaxID=3131995 RepID=UPI0030CB310D
MEKVSILIPTYNAEKDIYQLISKLYNQKLYNIEIEIIIVDSSSMDNTINILLNNFPEVHVKIIDNSNFDHGGTRNYLVSLAKGDYLLFMTQDAIPYDEFLIQNLINTFKENDKVLINYARQMPKDNANPLEIFARNFNYPNTKMLKDSTSIQTLGIKTFFNSNVCSMYKRIAFDLFGLFPEKIILNEDMIFASKVIFGNYKIAYSANAKVFHSHSYNINQQFKRYFDIGMAFEYSKDLLKHVSNEKEGFRMVLNQIKYLINVKKPYLIPYAFLETVVKFIAYNIGKRHHNIPLGIKKRLSAYMK